MQLSLLTIQRETPEILGFGQEKGNPYKDAGLTVVRHLPSYCRVSSHACTERLLGRMNSE
eukprot:scaffold25694_cov127-Cylindrotheca_fusiformis.AAC.4